MSIKDYLLHYKQFKFLLDETKFQDKRNKITKKNYFYIPIFVFILTSKISSSMMSHKYIYFIFYKNILKEYT